MLEVTVNGERIEVESTCTVADLLRCYDLEDTACAVEVNSRLVPHRERDTSVLAGGDTIEIVTLVGGG